jgi:hypothetical protein
VFTFSGMIADDISLGLRKSLRRGVVAAIRTMMVRQAVEQPSFAEVQQPFQNTAQPLQNVATEAPGLICGT